jgi:uncharacterized membrane protein
MRAFLSLHADRWLILRVQGPLRLSSISPGARRRARKGRTYSFPALLQGKRAIGGTKLTRRPLLIRGGFGRNAMATQMHQHPHSTAQIAGHPIHPMLIPFPIAFFVGTLLTDILFAIKGDPFWSRMSFYLLCAGLAMAALAALAGLTDFLGDRLVRQYKAAWHHMIGNVTAVVLEIASLFVRSGPHNTDILPVGLLISAAVVVILLYTGWRGWELVYRHHTGISEEPI